MARLKFTRPARSLIGGVLEYEIGVDELKAALDAGRPVFLLDVREPWEYQLARIEGSTLVPMNTLPARLHELDRDTHTVVICHVGRRSLDVTYWLRRQGFDKTQSLRGGVDAWARSVDPKVPVY